MTGEVIAFIHIVGLTSILSRQYIKVIYTNID